jgi:hypothetical protein
MVRREVSVFRNGKGDEEGGSNGVRVTDFFLSSLGDLGTGGKIRLTRLDCGR